ncbi:MAG: serine hydrolase domain-containing protein [Bacteroidia bacterium]
MGKIRFLLAIISCSICANCFGQDQKDFDKLFTRWNDSIQKPGMAIAVIHEGRTILKEAVGFSNLEYQIPLDHKSIFDIASLAKQFTGFAIANLIKENKVDLTDSAYQYFPDLEILNKGILLEHLVHHSSGLRDIGELFALANMGENLTAKETLILLKNQQDLNFTPGTEFDYSNTNYVLLALIVEQISGITFQEWCKLNIFSPLKMENTFVNNKPTQIINNRAIAYYSNGNHFSFQQNNGMALIGSSAVYSSLDDMILWINALESETVFPDEFNLMKQKGHLDNGDEIGYGFGLGIGKFREEPIIEHSGATPSGFRAQIAIVPNQSLAFIILSNWGDISPIDDFGIEIINRFIAELDTDLETDNEEQKPVIGAPIILSQEIANRYVGDYLFNSELNVKIRQDGENNLTVQLEDQPKVPLIPLTETKFDLPALNSIIHFSFNSAGICETADILMGDRKEGELRRIKLEEKAPINYKKYIGLYYCEELEIVFKINSENNRLFLTNTKQGEINLKEKSNLIFIPENGIASSLSFNFNEAEEVDGFLLNRGSRVRNLRFTKLSIEN